MTEDEPRLFGGVLPLDDVESGAIDLAGRFAELVDRLRAALDALGSPQTLASWAATIAAAADALTACGQRDAWQRAGLERLLDDVVGQAEVAAGAEATTLALPEVRALLAERLRGRPTRANFRTGHVTVCTLMPMRSVPHRVVCLLGLDDGAFPRKAPRDGDDLTVADPHVGDRDPRAEDRQLLLDALLAATDRLIITYTGNDERTNTPRPPAVPVGELLDVVDRTVRAPDGEARDHVVVRHPLQPFDPRNFTVGAIERGRAWSFDGVTLDGARALSAPRAEPPAFLAAPLPSAAAPLVAVEDLVSFVQRPVRAFLRQRLGVSVGEVADEVEDTLPVELDALEVWNIGQRLIDERLAGVEPRAAIKAELARGVLPPGLLARPVVERVHAGVEEIVAAARELLPGGAQPASVDVKVALGGGRTLSGTVPGVCGDVLRTVTYSRVDARHRLALWVRWLALTAARPERPFEAVAVGRARSGAPGGAAVTVARLPVAAGDPAARREFALRELSTLVDLYDRGMREPLPLACRTSAAYAEAAAAARDAAAAAAGAWQSDWSYDKEDRAPEHQLVHGGVLSFEDLIAEPARADESGEGWHPGQTSRFGRYACRLWAGLLAHEAVSDR
jgi:exodeoxyribonuclease V gamma subunit